MNRPLCPLALVCLFAMTVRGADMQTAPGAADFIAQRSAVEASYRAKLNELTNWCDQNKLPQAAALARTWLPARDPLKFYIFKLPDTFRPPPKLDAAESAVGEFWARFVRIREAQADALLEIAEQAHAAAEFTLAYDLVREACRENPDHAQAREILGYVRCNGGWALPDTARRLAARQVDDGQFGWLPAGYIKRYQEGQRYFRGKWISAEEDERLHSAIGSGWRIDSEHYSVTTNHSLEEGVRLSRRLEVLYDVWRHVFVDYYTPHAVMQQWFQAAAGPAPQVSSPAKTTLVRRRHQVTYFRNRNEYNNALRPLQPQIEITLGIYFARPRTAYFFAGDEQYAGTLLHEGTHQLFQETRQTRNAAGVNNNFWAVEAVACYVESLVEDEHWYTLGGKDEGRVPAARKRLLEDQFYMPWQELTAAGMIDLQHNPHLPKIYSQISGQAWFLMHGNGGQYRRPFLETLIAIYTGKAQPDTLPKEIGRTYEELDREYHRFMQSANAE